MWKLQENALDKKDLLSLSKYILKSPKLTQGKEVKKFENKFSKWNNSKYSILVNSGSSANLIMIYAAKEYYMWKNQDEIIVPSLTWPTTVNPVMQAGLKPIFIDTNFQDLSIDYEELKKKINKKTKAIFLAHILGFPSDLKKIKKIINGKNIKIFEDCCESIGAKINKKKVGNFGVAGSFSFYWGHHISTIEGGMITTNDKKFYDLCKMKRSHGFARELDKKNHKHIKDKYKEIDFNFLFLTDGFNLRSTNLNAFLGIRQIAKLNKFIKIRNNNFILFNNLLKKYQEKFYIINQKNLENISSFSLPLIFKNKSELLKTKKLLVKNKIEYRPIISGDLTKQPYLKKYKKKNYYSSIINSNGIYLGNNQFVNFKNFKLLNKILLKVFY